MKRVTQSGLLMVIGVIALTATLNNLFLNFVKPIQRIPIMVAAALLLAMGLYGIFVEERRRGLTPLAERETHDEHDHGDDDAGHGHDHTRGPRIGWMLVLPFLLMSMVVPPPLGAFSAEKDSGELVVQSADGLEPLRASDTPVEVSLSEYAARALYDPGLSLKDREVSLTGFSSPGPDGSWYLTRMVLACCAADGYAVKVVVKNAPPVAKDTWVTVVGTWEPTDKTPDPTDVELPVLVVTDLREVSAPENPYE